MNRMPVVAARRHAAHRSIGKPIFDVQAIEQGQVPSRKILFVGKGSIPAHSAAWLRVAAGEEAVIRQRLQLLNGVPAVGEFSRS
jgi:GntR family transcriptional regulator